MFAHFEFKLLLAEYGLYGAAAVCQAAYLVTQAAVWGERSHRLLTAGVVAHGGYLAWRGALDFAVPVQNAGDGLFLAGMLSGWMYLRAHARARQMYAFATPVLVLLPFLLAASVVWPEFFPLGPAAPPFDRWSILAAGALLGFSATAGGFALMLAVVSSFPGRFTRLSAAVPEFLAARAHNQVALAAASAAVLLALAVDWAGTAGVSRDAMGVVTGALSAAVFLGIGVAIRPGAQATVLSLNPASVMLTAVVAAAAFAVRFLFHLGGAAA